MPPGVYRSDPATLSVCDNQVVANATIRSDDVDVSGYKQMTVLFRLRGTTTPADLAAMQVRAYMPDGTLHLSVHPAVSAVASGTAGADCWALQTYDLRGLQRINVKATNNNAAPKNMDVIVYLTP